MATECAIMDEEIHISAFKNIHIHFPGDVYLLAIWVAMSNKARSTSTCRSHTTLHGLANKFVSLYGINYANPLTSEDVLAIFCSHGIRGNPLLVFDTMEEMPQRHPLIDHSGGGNETHND